MRRRTGAALLAISAGAAAFAWYVAATGGLQTQIGSIVLRSRSPDRPAVVALAACAVGVLLLRREAGAALRRYGTERSAAAALAWMAACWAGAAAVGFGTFAAGGSDSSGYLAQAELFAAGRLTDTVPDDPAFGWRDVQATLTPLGFTPSTAPGVIVPQYPPGLPLLMAPFALAGPGGAFVVVPLLATVAVLICARLGRELGDPLAGALAALLLASSPTFLYQAVQPMSDVPVTAAWTLALLLARARPALFAAAAGLVGGLAVMIRPNLAPLLLLVIAASATASSRSALGRAVLCSAAAVPPLIALGAIQEVRFGSPFASGYGPLTDLFSPAYVLPNLHRYPRWMIEAHTPFIALWAAAPIVIMRLPQPALGWIGYAFCIAIVLAYLPYIPFGPDEWHYTRFLLPALPFMLLFGTLTVLAALRRALPRRGALVGTAAMITLAGVYLLNAAASGALHLRDGERKFPAVGAFVRERLPENAFVFAKQHSGSIRYYSGRPILRWDVLDPASMDRALEDLQRAGYAPYLVLDPAEQPVFRERFERAAPAALARLRLAASVEGTRILSFEDDAR